jgi:hypothetical protein
MMVDYEWDRERHEGYLDVRDCAARMGLTVEQVMDLVRCSALRAVSCGILLVEPAITNITP